MLNDTYHTSEERKCPKSMISWQKFRNKKQVALIHSKITNVYPRLSDSPRFFYFFRGFYWLKLLHCRQKTWFGLLLIFSSGYLIKGCLMISQYQESIWYVITKIIASWYCSKHIIIENNKDSHQDKFNKIIPKIDEIIKGPYNGLPTLCI